MAQRIPESILPVSQTIGVFPMHVHLLLAPLLQNVNLTLATQAGLESISSGRNNIPDTVEEVPMIGAQCITKGEVFFYFK